MFNHGEQDQCLLAITSLISTTAARAESKNTSLYCVAEFAEGAWFNSSIKRWDGSVFRPESKFIMRATFLRTRTDQTTINYPIQFDDYNVTITESGSDFTIDCYRDGEGNSKIVSFNKFSRGQCKTGSMEYVFNLKTNSFLQIYSAGYKRGQDNNNDTPSISGGTCTKME